MGARPALAPFSVEETFKTKFELARKVGDKGRMRQLIKGDNDAAVAFILEVAEGIANNPNELVFERMEALRESWKAEMRTDFCEKMESFFSKIPTPFKRDRRRLRLSYDKLSKEWHANVAGKRERGEGLALSPPEISGGAGGGGRGRRASSRGCPAAWRRRDSAITCSSSTYSACICRCKRKARTY